MIKKVLFVVVALMLTCSLVIGTGSSTAKAQSKKGTKLIKIWVNEDTGQVLDVRLGKDDGSEQDSTLVSPIKPAQYIGTILFHKQGPGCTLIVTGGDAWQVCYPSLKAPEAIKIR